MTAANRNLATGIASAPFATVVTIARAPDRARGGPRIILPKKGDRVARDHPGSTTSSDRGDDGATKTAVSVIEFGAGIRRSAGVHLDQPASDPAAVPKETFIKSWLQQIHLTGAAGSQHLRR